MSKRTKILISVFGVSAIFILLLIIVLIFRNDTTTSDPNNNEIISYPVSNVNTEQQFTLNQINVATPLTGKSINYTFSSNISTAFSLQSISDSEVLINSDKFSLFMTTPAESFGGIYEAKRIETVDTQFGGNIYRIQETTPAHTSSIFKNHNKAYFNQYYFYGRGSDAECAPIYELSYCGSPDFGIRGEDIEIVLYCATSDESFVKYCDEFVNNLELISKEELIRPVSYYR